MEQRDFIVTPVIILLVYVAAYLLRPHVTDEINRRYFFPALTLKIIGALALGFLYQFYYGGGDTFMYHTRGSRIIWETFVDSPLMGLKLLFANEISPGVYKHASQIAFFGDPQSYNVVRIAALSDLFTFSTYSASAVLFSVLSFIGMWMLFLTFYKQYPQLHRSIAVSTLFIPSVIIWGSGILKDTITLSCLGIATYFIHAIFFERKVKLISVLFLTLSLYVIFSIKVFILQAFIPAAIVWIIAGNFEAVKSIVLKIMLVPFVIAMMLIAGYYAVVKIGESDSKYSIENMAQTARITAYDIRYYTGREAGSGYSIGELDGSLISMLRLSPQALNVSLFRPYLWEVRNPLMLLSAMESIIFLFFTLYVIGKKKLTLFKAFTNANILFCLIFSLTFAMAVGISTFNFGTLARYKIPLLPYYAIALVYILNYSNRDKKVEVFESTE